jgi:hypothetical protein
VDFIFSYDVQLHLQPENVFGYMCAARRVLRDHGVFMLHQINLASAGGMEHFLSQYHFGSWKLDLYHPMRRGFIYFMSADQMSALADAAGLAVADILSEFPSKGSALWETNRGRDVIGFLRLMPSRLRDIPRESVRLVRAAGNTTVYAVANGERMAFASPRQMEIAGFRMDEVEVLEPEDVAGVREAEPLAAWE